MNCPKEKCNGAKLGAMRTDAYHSCIMRTRRCPKCLNNYKTVEILNSDLEQRDREKEAAQREYEDLMDDLKIFKRVLDRFEE